jgi:uncharacterized protein (TIGR00725 family)
MRRRLIAVIGGRAGNASRKAWQLAEAVGAEIAHRGFGMISGGDDGIADAAAKGCSGAGGEVVALLKWNRPEAGPFVTWAIPTSMDLARSNPLIWSGEGVIAFEGSFGTLGEIALALDTGRPMVVTGRQRLLRWEAVDVPTCRFLPDVGPADAGQVLDVLMELIHLAELPPRRPTP